MTLVLKEQQQAAYDSILRYLTPSFGKQEKFYVLSGSAGTGKTFLLGAVNEKLGRFGSVFTAPTNKATKVAQNTIGEGALCKTIFSLLGIKMVADEDRLILKFPRIPVDLSGYSRIFVDEGSMISSPLLEYIQEQSERYDTKWIFVGDEYQLPPVGEKNSKIWSLNCPTSRLTQIVRYDNEILNFATRIRKNIERYPKIKLKFKSDHSSNSEGIWKYNRGGFMRNIELAAKKGLFSQVDNTKAIAWRNKTVTELNEFIRYAIFGKQADKHPWLVGDRLMVSEPVQINGNTLAHIDDEGTIIEITETYHSIYKDLSSYNVTVQIDSGRAVTLNIIHPKSEAKFNSMLNKLAAAAKADSKKWKEFWMLKNSFHGVRYSYALTAHRAQGSTYENTFVDTADIMANANSFEALRCLYVAATRCTTRLILV